MARRKDRYGVHVWRYGDISISQVLALLQVSFSGDTLGNALILRQIGLCTT
jgi:hypothetical protein